MPAGSKTTVLIVDDEPSNRTIAERVLASVGYEVMPARDATEALRIIDAHGPFSVYVVDVMMPGVRGTQLAQEIRTRYPTAKILYFTAFSRALFTTSDRVLRDDEAFLQKPVSNRELLEAVSLLLFGHIKGPTR
jgi:CheY-like chemotaxis protein